jgi:uncharacterized protein with ParB-like and HNH nuclease domain
MSHTIEKTLYKTYNIFRSIIVIKEVIDMNELQKEIDSMVKAIKTDSYPMSIGELSNVYKEGDLIINPEYQRLFRWEISQQSNLIESILLGIPIPPIYVYQTNDGKWDLIDGQQRLSTIFKFMGILKDNDGNIVESEPLVKTKFLPSLAGKLWISENEENSLTEAQRRYIKRSKIDIIIIDKSSDKFAQYEMFQRLNTGGTHLSAQEIRNCVLIMNNRETFNFFKELSNFDEFKKSIPLSEKDEEQQGYMEQVIRYFVLKYSKLDIDDWTNYHDFLTDEIINIIDSKVINYDSDRQLFKRIFCLLYELFEDSAFKKYDYEKNKFTGPVLVGAYEAIIPGLIDNLDFYEQKDNHASLIDLVKGIYKEVNYLDAVKRGVRPVTRLKKLANFSRELFGNEN